MKKLLFMLLLPLLSGCVTYYYPETAIDDGVYYAEDDPAYNNNAYVNYSYGYAGAAYYPWRSMDYFYLGYGPRFGYGYGYGGYGWGGGGFSLGISYGYSPWYYPYYGYYSPWYYSRYGYGHGYGYGHRKGHGNYGGGHDNAGGDHGRYADNDGTDRRNRSGEDGPGVGDSTSRRSNHTSSPATSPVRRYVSTAPSGYAGNQGMVVRSRETTKIGKSRLEPVNTAPLRASSPMPSTVRTTPPDYRTRGGSGEIRYRSATKQGRSRTGPVGIRPPAQEAVVSTPAPTVYRSRAGGAEVRYRSDSKQGKSRTNPVRTSPLVSATPSSSGARVAGTSSNYSQPRSSGAGNRSSGHSNSGRSSSSRASSGRSSSGRSSSGRSSSGHGSAGRSSGHTSGHR